MTYLLTSLFYHVLNLLSVLECFAFDSIRPISLTYLYLLTTFSLLQTRFLASLLPLQFKEKASAYFNADGSLNNLSPQDYRERLLGTLDKYRETLEGHNKSVAELRERVDETKAAESALKKALSQAKKKAGSAELSLQRAIKKAETEKDAKPSKKSQTTCSSATKTTNIVTEDEEEGIAKARVSGVLDILRITADKRRSQLESKRHNHFFNHRTAWKDGEDDAEDWPDSLKRSMAMRIQRRRVQITLRPSRRSILSDVKMELEKKLAPDQTANAKSDPGTLQEQALRAEQVLLLSLHPAEVSPRLPQAPKTSSSSERWAEPGWRLVLDVPRKKMASASMLGRPILPPSTVASHADSLHDTLLSECLSAPGRQTALMMQQSQLRLLCNPLSDLSRASAPAETHPAGISPSNLNAHKANGLGLDPMNVSEEEMLKGYSFVAKKRKSSSASTRRKRTNSKERKQGSGDAKKRRTSKATSSKKKKETSPSPGNIGATSPASKSKGTDASSGEKSHAPTSSSVKHPNRSMQIDSLPQPPAPMQTFSPGRPAAVPNQNSQSSMAYSNSNSTSSPGYQRGGNQGGELRTGNIPPFNEAQMAIPQPPPPPQQQRIQQNVYHQQQQQQHRFYQQQQQQQMYFAAQQQAAASQQMQSPMQPQYQQMQFQGQPTQRYSGQAYPIHQMQGRGGPSSGGGKSQSPPPPMMGQGMNMSGMPLPGATNPNDSHFQQKRR